MPKLGQIVAVEQTAKSRAENALTQAYHLLQKDAPLSGQERTYQPIADEGEQLPPESEKVMVRADDVIENVNVVLAEALDVAATKDWTNTTAKADVKIDGNAILTGVPISHLLFLEKQLVGIHTFVKKLPTLNPAYDWHEDTASGLFKTDPITTTKNKKTPHNHVKWAPPTPEFKQDAQVETYFTDDPIGHWTTIKLSGAIEAPRVAEMLRRVETLQRAIKFAREEANQAQTVNVQVGQKILDFVFSD